MNFEWEFRSRPQGLNDRRTHTQVRNEMAVHDIDMQSIRAGPLDNRHFFAEPGEIGRQD
jgi:hypothetical protein